MRTEARIFALCLLALIASGLLCLYSASWPQALEFGMRAEGFLVKQALFALAALAAWPAVRRIPVKWLKALSIPILAVCLVLTALTLTRLGKSGLGARRWLRLGPLPAFQPSELLKLATIIFLARLLSGSDDKNRSHLQLVGLLVCLLGAGAILLQRDYSTAALHLGVGLLMLSRGGLKAGPALLTLGAIGIGGGAVLLSAPYRVRRLAAFLFPGLDPMGIGYQTRIAAQAVSSGGLWGKGPGLGFYKRGVLPEVQNDYILANIAEETGFIGIAGIFCLFGVFGAIGLRAARRLEEKDRFEALAVFGCSSMVLFQALANAAVVCGLLPPTGIPLPFFSQGGTNLLVVVLEALLILRGVEDSLPKDQEGAGPDLGDVVLPKGL